MAWHKVANVAQLEDDEVVPVSVGNTMIALIKQGGQVFGTSNVCTHQFALMSDGYVDDDCIECPLHQARFHIATGRKMSGPECADLRTYPVRIEDGLVYVDCDAA